MVSRMLSEAYSRLSVSNRVSDFPSWTNVLTTATPDTCSCRKAERRASFLRISRLASRMNFFSTSTKRTSTGRTAKVTRASAGFIQSRMAAIPRRTVTSPTVDTSPEEMSSCSASTSEVRRVISRPVGVRSKKETGSRSSRENISCRMARMTRWPSTETESICT